MKSTFLVLGLFATVALSSYQDKDHNEDYHNKNVKSYDYNDNPWVSNDKYIPYGDQKDDHDGKKETHYKRFKRSRRSKRSPVPTDEEEKDENDDYKKENKQYDDDKKDENDDYKKENKQYDSTDDDKKDENDDYNKENKQYDPYYNPNLKSYDPYDNPWVPDDYYNSDDNKSDGHYKRAQ
ncbi:18914_t:CDS:1 [Funneliformis geosporum]|uniref:9384_t:CDS:1 n=1 Tax=Funneliformis geosporum TaxID=1117311 RepID=A0A9W4SYD3_9GLOM|nr:9384_t:CDS:1 [Funneliformis geosporum]CAI2186667.1 18914_t:CDS:1 [Funneliformis geosporum]